MSFWNKFKFKRKPFKEPLEEKKEELEIKKKVEPQKKISAPVKKESSSDKSSVDRSEVKEKKVKKAYPEPRQRTRPKKKEDTGDAYRVLIKPIISEKVTKLGEINQYVFEIAPHASKNEVKKAIEKVYGVDSIKVRIVNKIGKKVRFGRNFGKLKDRKKAIVTLKKGETIQIYEGV